MPYITEGRRTVINSGASPITPGELNYALTKLVMRYQALHGLNYQTINDIVGALEGAKAEYQRRIVAPYEDNKRAFNGDVYVTGPEEV